ncbi:5,6-dimethylbenzimidazole synthase [Epibacterium ulvae]|uniref:5,6-dimethylbenzimidazole synthase n=1 Tax=Epibacterium ulvae TaxID=1156985 RepID=UPI001BFC8195|nr:5,6-dimethylbenzimidazole synthase [Epibacterium ulvae]MBT8153333.1 5,6-dimethylbenzimidazole synthase [Epibacterium ulvae]
MDLREGTGFTDDFRRQLELLMQLRRDVRRFKRDAIDEAAFMRCLDLIQLAPSVGLSEPWRVIRVKSDSARAAALKNFEAANADALAGYSGDKSETYASLKLSGMRDAPEQIAIYCDDGTEQGSGLGAATMPEMRRYSVVAAIMLFWLGLRAEGLGLGWVSILDPAQMNRDLDVPPQWKLIGYFCVGYPERYSDTPELQQVGWEDRRGTVPVETR